MYKSSGRGLGELVQNAETKKRESIINWRSATDCNADVSLLAERDSETFDRREFILVSTLRIHPIRYRSQIKNVHHRVNTETSTSSKRIQKFEETQTNEKK